MDERELPSNLRAYWCRQVSGYKLSHVAFGPGGGVTKVPSGEVLGPRPSVDGKDKEMNDDKVMVKWKVQFDHLGTWLNPADVHDVEDAKCRRTFDTYEKALNVIDQRVKMFKSSKANYRIVQVSTSDAKPTEKLGKPDMVNSPSHYTRLDPQPIEVIEAWNLDFFMGSAIKYIARAGFKSGEEAAVDLKKAVSFINRRIASMEGKPVVVK